MTNYNWWKCVFTWSTNTLYQSQLITWRVMTQNCVIFFFVVLAQLLTTLVWIECDDSYFLQWWGHIFVFCAKNHIIISFLSEPFYLDWLHLLFKFFFWVIIDGLFSPPWIFSIDMSFYLPHPWFIIHALRSAYFPTLHVSLPNFDLALRVQGL